MINVTNCFLFKKPLSASPVPENLQKTAFSKSIMLEIRAYYANVMFYIYNVIIFSKYLHSFLYFSHILCKNRAIRTLRTAECVLCTHIARAK